MQGVLQGVGAFPRELFPRKQEVVEAGSRVFGGGGEGRRRGAGGPFSELNGGVK